MAERVDLNTADRDTLAQLPGIGNVLAERIIDFRENVHPFEEVIELTAVSGISERMVRKLEDRLTVAPIATGQDVAAPLVIETPLEEPLAEPTEEEEPAAEPAEGPAEPARADEPETGEEAPMARDEAEEATAEEEQIPAPADSVAPPAPGPSAAGCIRSALLLVVGAFMGTALTLLFLFLLNGTLLFAGRSQVRTLQQEVEVQNRQQETLSTDVDSAAEAVATVTGAQETMAAAQFSTAQDVRDLQAEVEPAVATLEAQNAIQATRLSRVAAAAVNFNTFLDNLRDLLIGLQGLPTATATATASPTRTPAGDRTTPTSTAATATPGADEGTGTATPPAPSRTPTPAATRTLRPTATPIVPPTTAPANRQ